MSHDRYGRLLNARGGSPPTAYTKDQDRVHSPPRKSLTDQRQPVQPSVAAIRHPRPVRSRTGPQLATPGPRIPRNRFSSLQTEKSPLRTTGSVSTMQTGVVSPPAVVREQRVPPVVTIAVDSDSARTKNTRSVTPPKRTSIPGYRSRCVESDSEDEILTDSVHETIKPSRDISSYMTTTTSDHNNTSTQLYFKPSEINYLKQDSGIDQEMDTVQSPLTSPSDVPSVSNFDPKTYQKHLDDIQKSAMEWSRLQEGLAMLLPNSDGDTGFHNSVIHTKPNILAKLIELVEKYPQLNTCVNDQNSLFQTALHLSVHLQQVDMMKMLINAGASLHLQDHKGNTPLHIACQYKYTACLDVLLSTLDHRTLSDLAEIRNYEGNSCIHLAAYAENVEGLLKLCEAGVPVDIKTYGSNKTALHIAIEKGSFQLTQALIQSCGADFNRPMFSGCTPLHIAAGWNNIEIVAYLISLGADPYAITDEGDMPIDLVTSEGVRQFLVAVSGV